MNTLTDTEILDQIQTQLQAFDLQVKAEKLTYDQQSHHRKVFMKNLADLLAFRSCGDSCTCRDNQYPNDRYRELKNLEFKAGEVLE